MASVVVVAEASVLEAVVVAFGGADDVATGGYAYHCRTDYQGGYGFHCVLHMVFLLFQTRLYHN